MPGDSGIFATCNKGREKKCVGELRDLFSEYATQLYGDAADGGDDDGDEVGGATSIENDIQAELAGIQKPATAQLFVPVKLEVQCGEFFEGEDGGFVYFVFPSFPLPCARFNTPTQQQKTKIMKNPETDKLTTPLFLLRSGFLQNNRPSRARQFRAEDLRGRDGGAHAQADADGQEAGADDFDGQGHDGRAGERGEGCAGAAFPSGAGDAEEGEFFLCLTHIEVVDGSMLVWLVGGGFTFSCDGMGCDGLGCAEQCLDYVQGADLNALFTVCREA